jgi:hypothetical protein
MPRLTWITILLLVLLYVAEMTGMYPHARLLVEIGSGALFALAGVEL